MIGQAHGLVCLHNQDIFTPLPRALQHVSNRFPTTFCWILNQFTTTLIRPLNTNSDLDNLCFQTSTMESRHKPLLVKSALDKLRDASTVV